VNNFEFLRFVNIGQYLPLDSYLHRLDPRARILAYGLIIVAVTFTPRPHGLVVGLLLMIGLLLVGRIPLHYAFRSVLPPLPFLLILAVMQIFLAVHPADAVPFMTIGPVSIFSAGLLSAGMLLLRFTVLILAIGLASFTLSTSEMIHGLEALLAPLTRIGIPTHDFVMVVQVTVRFIPFLAQAAERIAKAQASRGAEWGVRKGNLWQRARQVAPLMVPLFLTSLRRAETMALAMDARGYGNPVRRTSLITMQFLWRDGLVVCLAVLLAAAMLFLGR